ncbi:MAG: 2-oxoglutarate dehydrogenase complex dihydrolipoyllysine-residue succinyltransferase [Acidobacteria bacterium]|nr:2-oxoglutarate dehydrogenase complex dihydrolipoyllysine-residue succinyltransferase [Acidobacteriota bacterium]MCB9398721.1 2-oxoglutarate dehydrogenase complex dihydrolipoyllysine-residue succinyltransferase [Acidobacteriota bacterium]
MAIEIKVPQAGESVTEAMIGQWFKANGSYVEKDEPLLEFETDKSNLELVAEQAGVLTILAQEGEVVKVGQVVGKLDTEAKAEGEKKEKSEPAQPKAETKTEAKAEPKADTPLSPAVRRVVEEHKLDPAQIPGSGKDGRILKEDAMKAAQSAPAPAKKAESPASAPVAAQTAAKTPASAPVAKPAAGSRSERTVPMSMLRRRIAQRLVEAQHSAAILTTFNEIDMTAMMEMRSRYNETFQKKYGLKLGFMSFFVKACVEALKAIPEINAQIRDNQIIYHDYCDVGVAVGTDRGLVVPVIRDAHLMGFAQIEQAIADYANKARQGKISLDDLSGGTFTISNGGVYGSLLSTPILNPPQSGILGMHKIEKRAVVVDDQIVIRPMMYVALSYDHRIVDGKEAVTFLVKVKESLEDPARLLLEI